MENPPPAGFPLKGGTNEDLVPPACRGNLKEGVLAPTQRFFEQPLLGYTLIEKVKATRYFVEQVLQKRPYIQPEWCEQIVRQPLKKEVQPDGRIRYWGYVPELGRYLRVVTLEDGETLHNAFPDRNFKPEGD